MSKVKSTKAASSRKPKQSESPAQMLSIDPMEVMKAMLAAKKDKGKGKDDGSSDGSEDEDSGSDNANGERSGFDDEEGDEDRDESEEEVEKLGQSSRGSASKSPSPDIKTSHPPVAALADTSLSRVRVNPTQNASKPVDPFQEASKPPPTTTFESLGLSQPLITALAGINIKKPTEIQAACVKAILSGRDCIGGAKTGSGKTMAFALPIVERIARDPYGVWAVILTPTRELAYQLTEQFLVIGKPLGLTTTTIVGGMDSLRQAQQLHQQPHIIVATPGRLCDLLRSDPQSQGKLGRVKTLVLDEADRLLTPTFAPELAYLFGQIPKERQTCLFTATVSEAIMELANRPPAKGKEKPFVYRVESDTLTVANLKQKYLFIPSQIRDPYLYYILHHPPSDIDSALRSKPGKQSSSNSNHKNKSKQNNRKRKARYPSTDSEEDPSSNIPSTIIFTQRCATAHLLHLMLGQLDIQSVPLHSHLTQPQRLLSLARFRAGEVPILITTDVGSRGLDIPEVSMVINWDCPRRSDDYVHRVGRTARAGRGGVAITIITERDTDLIIEIEQAIGTELVEMNLPEEEVLEKLNTVAVARRVATMEMHDSNFGERQATNKAKQIKRAKRDAARG